MHTIRTLGRALRIGALALIVLHGFGAALAQETAAQATGAQDTEAQDSVVQETGLQETELQDSTVVKSDPWSPPTLSGEPISLMEAVRITLESNPAIRIQDESTRFQMGLLQQAKGEFDWTLDSGLSYEKIRSELREAVVAGEQKIRDKISESIDETGERVTATDRVIGELRQMQQNPDAGAVTDPDLQTAFGVLDNLITNAGSAADRQELIQLRSDLVDEALSSYESLAASLQVGLTEDIADLENLGAAPDEEERYNGEFTLGLSKTTRSGFSFGPLFKYDVVGNQYVGKPVDTDHGGKGIEDVYRATLGFFFDTPLARGLGKGSAGALERAAEIEYDASLATLRQTAASSLFTTLIAYWDAVAAEQRAAIFEQSVELQSRLVELTQTLIEADEQPGSELARVQAVEADRRAALDAARRNAFQARLLLARVMGLQVDDEHQAPPPADDFPVPPDDADLPPELLRELQLQALARRDDYVAARRFNESARVLLRAAEIDLRPVLDLSTRAWTSAAAEDSASDAFSADWAGPSYNVGLDFQWPFANNTQEGLHLQAQSVSGIRDVQATNLNRLIRSGVVDTLGSIGETLKQIEFAAQAVGFYRETVESEIERYRHGVSTLIDTLLTEQRLTEAELFQTLTEQQFARLLAQLRFDTGTLITERSDGGMVIEESLLSLPATTPSAVAESEDG